MAIVVALIVSYVFSDPSTHLGSFFGNAIADWTGVLVTVIMTKRLYEKGSAESKQPRGNCRHPVGISARGFADGVSRLNVVCLDRNLSAYGPEQPSGTGNWQHRFGMDVDSGVDVDDQDRNESWIEEGGVGAGGTEATSSEFAEVELVHRFPMS